MTCRSSTLRKQHNAASTKNKHIWIATHLWLRAIAMPTSRDDGLQASIGGCENELALLVRRPIGC